MITKENIDAESILADLMEYISTLPDSKKWNTFFEGGVGQASLEVASGLGQYGAYHSMMAHREGNIQTAQIRKFVENAAASFGYNINLVQSCAFDITITPEINALWKKFTPIGQVDGNTIVPEEDLNMVYGQEMTFRAVVGEWKTFDFVRIETDAIYTNFTIPSSKVDNDLKHVLFKVENEGVTVLDIVRNARELNYGDSSKKILMKAFSDGLTFFHGNGLQGYKFKMGDESSLEYIESTSYFPESIDSIEEDIQITIQNSKMEIKNAFLGADRDTMEKCRNLALNFTNSHATMITPQDWKTIPAAYTGNRDGGYAADREADYRVKVTYLLEKNYAIPDKVIKMSAYEKILYLKYLASYTIASELMEIVDPSRWGIESKIIVYVTELGKEGDMQEKVKAIFDSSTYQLNQAFNIGLVEKKVNELDNVTRCAFLYPVTDIKMKYNEFLGLNKLDLIVEVDNGQILKAVPEDKGYINPVPELESE